jgi:hypothetical protein
MQFLFFVYRILNIFSVTFYVFNPFMFIQNTLHISAFEIIFHFSNFNFRDFRLEKVERVFMISKIECIF